MYGEIVMSNDAKLCWLAAAVSLAVWLAIVGGMTWHWRDSVAHQRAPIEAGEASK
jgi:hypothetical protein